jgi:SAM-dependent methyltransferase
VLRKANDFAHSGPAWSDRADLGELRSVLDAKGSERVNVLMHGATLVAARAALALKPMKRSLLDFGCGTGRMLRFFAKKGWRVIGTDITQEMLDEARRFGLPGGAVLYHTDGVSIPLPDHWVDLVWVSGVLKYSLFTRNSRCRGGTEPDTVVRGSEAEHDSMFGGKPFVTAYAEIAKEIYRVVKPGGYVVNYEMYVDVLPKVFLPDFERAGFAIRRICVLRRYDGWPERIFRWRSQYRVPRSLVLAVGQFFATLRYHLDDPNRRGGGLRDYLFVWSKPRAWYR